jgi:hypothetical protein
MSLQVATYHTNTLIGLTAWNSEAQAYYLIPFAEVSKFFKAASEQLTIPEGLVDAAFDFMSNYSPENEVVLLTLNEDLLTVTVIDKYQPATKEAKAERLDWPLNKYIAFEYLQLNSEPNTIFQMMYATQELFKLSNQEYDRAVAVVHND